MNCALVFGFKSFVIVPYLLEFANGSIITDLPDMYLSISAFMGLIEKVSLLGIAHSLVIITPPPHP